MTGSTSLVFPKCHRKFRINNPLDRDFIHYEKLRKSGYDEQLALKKHQFNLMPPSGLDNYN